MMVERTLLAVSVSATLVVTACGGSDDDSDGDGLRPLSRLPPRRHPRHHPRRSPESSRFLPTGSTRFPCPKSRASNWWPQTFAGDGAEARYDLRYDGDPLDAQATYDDHAALLTEAGWVLTDGSTALVGTYELDGNTR